MDSDDPIDDRPSGGRSRTEQPIPGSALAAVTLLLIVGVVHGWLGFGCYLISEHRRLNAFEMILLWTGDALSVFWYFNFCLRWLMGRRTVERSIIRDRRVPRSMWLVMGSFALGVSAELLLTAKLTYDEYAGFRRAVPTVCDLTEVRRLPASADPWSYRLTGTYRDAAGMVHVATFLIREKDEVARLPPALAAQLRLQQPMPFPIVYDPQRPERHWVREFGWDDPNRLHYISILVLMFQFVFGMAAAHKVYGLVRARRHLPWWTELHKVFPLCCEAFVFAMFGGMECYFMHRMCP